MHKNRRGYLPDVFAAGGKPEVDRLFREVFQRFRDRLGDVGSTVHGPNFTVEHEIGDHCSLFVDVCASFAAYYAAP